MLVSTRSASYSIVQKGVKPLYKLLFGHSIGSLNYLQTHYFKHTKQHFSTGLMLYGFFFKEAYHKAAKTCAFLDK